MTNKIMDLDNICISPIKDKNKNDDKSGFCDHSCINSILPEDFRNTFLTRDL